MDGRHLVADRKFCNFSSNTNSISERVDYIGEGGDGADELWIALTERGIAQSLLTKTVPFQDSLLPPSALFQLGKRSARPIARWPFDMSRRSLRDLMKARIVKFPDFKCSRSCRVLILEATSKLRRLRQYLAGLHPCRGVRIAPPLPSSQS